MKDTIADLDDTLAALRRCVRTPGWAIHPDGETEAREALMLLQRAASRALVPEGPPPDDRPTTVAAQMPPDGCWADGLECPYWRGHYEACFAPGADGSRGERCPLGRPRVIIMGRRR